MSDFIYFAIYGNFGAWKSHSRLIDRLDPFLSGRSISAAVRYRTYWFVFVFIFIFFQHGEDDKGILGFLLPDIKKEASRKVTKPTQITFSVSFQHNIRIFLSVGQRYRSRSDLDNSCTYLENYILSGSPYLKGPKTNGNSNTWTGIQVW